MKFNFKIAALLLVAASGCRKAPLPTPALSDRSDVQRLVALVDYIANDYGGAVQGGRVLNQDEYEEQQRFLKDAHSIADRLLKAHAGPSVEATPDPLRQGLEGLDALMAAKAEPALMTERCRQVKTAVVERFGLRTAPEGRPSYERGRVLYAQSCVACHGEKGDANTEQARTLNPPPVNFRDPERGPKLSPHRVYNTLSFGISGTAMPSFEALSPEDRWSVAFYVLSLAHSEEPGEGVPAAMALIDLSSLSDEEIEADLRSQGHPSPPRGVKYLRTVVPFEAPKVATGVADTRARVRGAVTAYAAGRAGDADRQLLDAYLQGFEPMEGHFRARDPQGTAAVEKQFHTLRASVGLGRPTEELRDQAAALDRQLVTLAKPDHAVFPFVAALLIYLREGVEAALLVGALLAAVRRLGHADAVRHVHYGWIAALPAGIFTWWALDRLLALGSAERELMEAVTALLAAAVLFWVSFWLISKAESRRWMEYLRRSVASSLDRKNRLLLASMAFLAVYREAAETVLFTQALLLEAADQTRQVWLGALCGLIITVVIAAVMRRAVLSLPIGPFFMISGLLLCLLAVSFAGAGLYNLVGAGYLPARPVHFLEIPWMGLYPDLNGLLVQAAIVLTVAAAGVMTLRSAMRQPSAADTP
jgi:high-affinity iron transporter